MGYGLLKRVFETMVVNDGDAAPGRPNKSKTFKKIERNIKFCTFATL
jgi:hypothetical protein